jgi:transporter family protein
MNYLASGDWRVFAFGSAIFAALTAIFGKIGVATINSNLATFVRTIVILLVTAFILSIRKEWRLTELSDSRSMVFLVLSGITTGASWLCYYRALQIGPVSKVAPVDKMSVAMVIVLAALFLGEDLTIKTVIGGLLIVGGSIVLAI